MAEPEFDPAKFAAAKPEPEFDPAKFAAVAPSGFGWSQAITDIPREVGTEAGSALSDIQALGNRSEQGPLEGLMTTGKAALAVPRLIASPITGAARSLIGHPMANLEHKAGELIAPEIAAKDNPQQMYETAKSDVDTAMAAARPAGAPIKIGGAYEWQSPPTQPKPIGVVKQPDTEDFFDAAENNYSNMRGFGVEIDPAAMNRVADNITTELHAEGYRPRNVPKVFDAVEELRTSAGQNHEISDIDSVRKVLGKARLDPSERDAARRAIGHIDDYLANLGNNPQDVVVNPHFAARVADEATAARANYAAAKRSEDIDEALDQAQRQAARAGTGGNINNAIRQRLSALRNNKKKMAGWSDDEKAELDSVINGTTSANIARQAGKFAPHGIVSTVMSAGAGHVIAPGIGEVAVPAAGFIAKKIGDYLTKIAADRLSNVVKARSPLGKQTSINAAAQLALAPPTRRAPLISSNVPTAALQTAPQRLYVSPLIGTVPSAAEEKKQNGKGLRSNQPNQGETGKAHGGVVALKTKASVNYRHATSNQSCKTCKYSYGPTGDRCCKLVMGRIFPDDVCNLWKAKGRALGGAVFRAVKGYADGGDPTEDAPAPSYWDRAKAMLTGSGPIQTSTGVTVTPEDIDRAVNVGMGVGPLGIKAYHGSPHDFDAFDLSKIGTGEGAQAYGHGLYFAENPGVAESYKAAGQPSYLGADRIAAAKSVLAEAGGDINAARSLADQKMRSTTKYGEGKLWQDVVNNLPDLVGKTPGRMYEVDINADPEHFLDWDRPLAEQPENIRAAFSKAKLGKALDDPILRDLFGDQPVPNEYLGLFGRSKGSQAYNTLADEMKPPPSYTAERHALASQALRDAGIPGIKYLDQGSRNFADLKIEPHEFLDGSQGYKVNGPKGDILFDTRAEAQNYINSLDKGRSHNFVVFDDKLINIMRKYRRGGMA